METEDLDKILGKSYAGLDASEKEAIRDICASEEEFLQLQQFFASVESYAQETREEDLPSPEIKDRLDDLFNETYRDKGILWYNSLWARLYPTDRRLDQRPLVRIAAMLVLVLSTIPFLGGKQERQPGALADNSQAPKKEQLMEEKDKTEVKVPQPQEISSAKALAFSQPVPGLESADMMMDITSAGATVAADYTITQDKELTMETVSLSATSSYLNNYKRGEVSATYSWTHPDGIYMDSLRYGSRFTVNENMAVLDLLTPAF